MKNSKVFYWSSTVLVILIVGLGSFADLLQIEPIKESFKHIGFPPYMLPFFGVVKLLGCVGILMKSKPMLREWAYAGIIFYFIGATYIHIALGDGIDKIGTTLMILSLTSTSYYFSKKQDIL